MNIGEIVGRAIGVLEERGWCKGDYTNPSGQVCALGAIGVALGFAPADMKSGRVDFAKELERHPDLCLALYPYADPDELLGERVIDHVATMNDDAAGVADVLRFLGGIAREAA
jgi:hypothetical protein